MEIDFSLAPNDATHYMVQTETNKYYWFFKRGGDYLVAIDAQKERHEARLRHKVTKGDLEDYLEGEYNCVCTEINIVLENE